MDFNYKSSRNSWPTSIAGEAIENPCIIEGVCGITKWKDIFR